MGAAKWRMFMKTVDDPESGHERRAIQFGRT